MLRGNLHNVHICDGRDGARPFSVRTPNITPTPPGPSRCVIYRLVKIRGNKISPEDLRGRKVIVAERGPLAGVQRIYG